MNQKSPVEKVRWPGSTQLAPVPAVLVGCVDGVLRPYNLLTVAWTGIVCSAPPMLSISLKPERYSHDRILASGEFTVNLPTAAMAAATDRCGVHSGREHDKFREEGLTPLPGSLVAAPLVAECPLGLECRVNRTIELGSHTLFLADILAVQVSKEFLSGSGRLELEKAGLLAYCPVHYYTLGENLGHFGFSVRRKPGPKIRR